MTGKTIWFVVTNQNHSDDVVEITETVPDEPEQKLSLEKTADELRTHVNTSVPSILSSTQSMTTHWKTNLVN